MATVEYIELFWDCPTCSQTHISAVFNSQGNRCPNCLHWRTETVPLYEAPDSQIITDPGLIDRKPFWVCKTCQAVNEDVGLAPHLLQCGNCSSYQTSEVGGITGDLAADQQAPASVPVGEPIEVRKQKLTQTPLTNQKTNQKPKSRVRRLVKGLTWLNIIGGGILASVMVASHIQESSLLQVEVTDLRWTIEVDVQEQRTVTRQAWEDQLPSGAVRSRSERRQRGTRQEQRGSRTVMVPQQYQSGTRTETYSESERYQSGTRTETYTTSERERAGTEQRCRTTSRGNGVGERRCRSEPVYRTRQVQRTRQVPVYRTRQVQRTRQVPVYSTRMVPTQQPILVTVPVHANWITYQVKEWFPQQTHRQTGQDDAQRRSLDVRLTQQPLQRIAATRTTCRLTGNYSLQRGWFQPAELTSATWTLPCQDYDRIDIGDRVQLRPNASEAANLVRVSGQR